jgi:ankyrin repeat protein
VRLLIDKGADISATNVQGKTPLHIASRGGHEEVVRLLIDKGADVFSTDCCGQIPLHVARQFLRIEVVKLLTDREAELRTTHNDKRTLVRGQAACDTPSTLFKF